MSEDMDRTIVCEIPPCFFNVDPNTGLMTQQLDKYSGGWRLTPGFPNACIVFEGTIDLSGYAMDDLTFVPYASFKQDGVYSAFFDGVGYLRYDCVSSVPLDLQELGSLIAAGGAPGFINPLPVVPYPNVNRDVILHGDGQVWATDVNYPGTSIMTERHSSISSSLEPTAADKLYFYSLIILDANINADPSATPPTFTYGSYLGLAPRRIIIPGRWTQEPDIEYMMRLKRSYELANQV